MPLSASVESDLTFPQFFFFHFGRMLKPNPESA